MECLPLRPDQSSGVAADPASEQAEVAGLLHIPFAAGTVDGLDGVILPDGRGLTELELYVARVEGLTKRMEVGIGAGHGEGEKQGQHSWFAGSGGTPEQADDPQEPG